MTEVVLTKEEQDCKPILSSLLSKSAETTAHSRKAVKTRSAALLKENMLEMQKQPGDDIRQHLLKVCWSAVLTVCRLSLS